ncbi:tigger transposable element-derived protein 1-like [Palaemon carinicauda]|uniref:tigger transposable element-derived protein 1-like n=1 Tax=Palaemon carinicauda TaxID=392227 RepID=UPI0035B66025
MNCAGGHANDLHYGRVQVEFLPPNTTSLIQPLDQGVIRAFKALYTRSTMEGLISFIDEGDEDFRLKIYWREYNIATCLANIQKALNEIKEQPLNAIWRKLWPGVVHYYERFTPDEVHHSAVDKAVRLARLVANEGFSDTPTEDVNLLVECHLEPLTDEDLVEMTRSASKEEEEAADVGNDEAEERGLTLDNLQELCNKAWAMQQRAQEIDDNIVRAIEFSNRIDGVMALYKRIFAQMKKRQQLPIMMSLVHRKPFAEASNTSPAASPASHRATMLPPAVSPALTEAVFNDPPPLSTDNEASPEEQ